MKTTVHNKGKDPQYQFSSLETLHSFLKNEDSLVVKRVVKSSGSYTIYYS